MYKFIYSSCSKKVTESFLGINFDNKMYSTLEHSNIRQFTEFHHTLVFTMESPCFHWTSNFTHQIVHWKSLIIIAFYMKQHTSDKGNNISHIASQKLNFLTCYRFDCQTYLYFSFIINVNSPCNEDIKTITYSKVIHKASFEILKEKLG